MGTDLILWGALAVLIALMALAVWAGRRGLHALGVVGPARRGEGLDREQVNRLITQLERLNLNLERLAESGKGEALAGRGSQPDEKAAPRDSDQAKGTE
ncbi:MAG: hypothetical protein KI785_04420 [Devosiaceae bacterium]|nr:hypothetical protein [Devosiaceae bacterium MH13]